MLQSSHWHLQLLIARKHLTPFQRPNSWTKCGQKSLEFSSLLFTVTFTNGFYSPPPPPQDYAQKPQRNCTFMNSASDYISSIFSCILSSIYIAASHPQSPLAICYQQLATGTSHPQLGNVSSTAKLHLMNSYLQYIWFPLSCIQSTIGYISFTWTSKRAFL